MSQLQPGEFRVTVECLGERDGFGTSRCGPEGDGVLYERTGKLTGSAAAFDEALAAAAAFVREHRASHRGHETEIEGIWPKGNQAADERALRHGFALLPDDVQRLQVTAERDGEHTRAHIEATARPRAGEE